MKKIIILFLLLTAATILTRAQVLLVDTNMPHAVGGQTIYGDPLPTAFTKINLSLTWLNNFCVTNSTTNTVLSTAVQTLAANLLIVSNQFVALQDNMANLSATNLQNGTINSNKLDTATLTWLNTFLFPGEAMNFDGGTITSDGAGHVYIGGSLYAASLHDSGDATGGAGDYAHANGDGTWTWYPWPTTLNYDGGTITSDGSGNLAGTSWHGGLLDSGYASGASGNVPVANGDGTWTWGAGGAGIDGTILTNSFDPTNAAATVLAAIISSNYVSNAKLAGSNFVKQTALDNSNFVSSVRLAGSNYITSAALVSSNYLSNASVASSNFVKQSALDTSNYVSNAKLAGSNYVTQTALNSSNYLSSASIGGSNFVKQTALDASNFVNSARLAGSNYVSSSALVSSNYISGVVATNSFAPKTVTNLTSAQVFTVNHAITNTQYGAALHTPSITSSNTAHAGGVSFTMTDGNDLTGKGGSISLSAGNNVAGGFPGGGILIDGADGGGAGHVIVTNLTVAGSSHLGTIDNFALKTAPDISGEFLYTFFYSGAPFLDTEQEAFFYENGDMAWMFGTDRMFYGNFTGNGSALTNLNASQLTSGTVPDARLSSNIPRLDANPNEFTGDMLVDGNLTIGNSGEFQPSSLLADFDVWKFQMTELDTSTLNVSGGNVKLSNLPTTTATGMLGVDASGNVVANPRPPEIIDCIFKLPVNNQSGTSMHWVGAEYTKGPWGYSGNPFFPYFIAGTNWNTICPAFSFTPELFVGRTNMQVKMTLASSNSVSIHAFQYTLTGGRANQIGAAPRDANYFTLNTYIPGFGGSGQTILMSDADTVQTTNITYNIALPLAAQTNNFTQPMILYPWQGTSGLGTNKSELYYLKLTVILQ